LYDTRPEAVAKAIAGIGKAYDKLVEKGRMGADQASLARERLQPAASTAELKDAALVVEAIVEDLDVKRALFAELEGIVGPDCILATNTSSISVTAIAAQLKRPERLVGMHFFNPVPLMALVEVISGVATDKVVADAVYATAEAWGKNPVHAKSTPGFIVNRVARPYYAEALRLLQEQAADAATLDAVMRECGRFPHGALRADGPDRPRRQLLGHAVGVQGLFQRPALHALGAAAGTGERRLPRPQIGARLLPLRRGRRSARGPGREAVERPGPCA
jgi:3-hydroxybutyryl-CoA dehydrogenase